MPEIRIFDFFDIVGEINNIFIKYRLSDEIFENVKIFRNTWKQLFSMIGNDFISQKRRISIFEILDFQFFSDFLMDFGAKSPNQKFVKPIFEAK